MIAHACCPLESTVSDGRFLLDVQMVPSSESLPASSYHSESGGASSIHELVWAGPS